MALGGEGAVSASREAMASPSGGEREAMASASRREGLVSREVSASRREGLVRWLQSSLASSV